MSEEWYPYTFQALASADAEQIRSIRIGAKVTQWQRTFHVALGMYPDVLRTLVECELTFPDGADLEAYAGGAIEWARLVADLTHGALET